MQAFDGKIQNLEKKHSLQGYIETIQSLLNECNDKLTQIDKSLKENPLSGAWRRLEAPKRDFETTSFLPYNRDEKVAELRTEEKPYLQHSEQLVLYYLNSHFDQINHEISSFLKKHGLQKREIHGAFFNLFSTRDMCERCAVCFTVDHAQKEGFTSRLSRSLKSYNRNNSITPFIVYAVSSRLPYGTPIGSYKLNSREYGKGIDSHFNLEKSRNTTELSKAHLSIQTYFFPHESIEFTEEDLNKENAKLITN